MQKILRSFPQLAGIPERDMKTLSSISALVTFKKDDIIFHVGEQANYAWFLISGKAILGNTSQNGNISASCIVRSGDLFCCLPIMDLGAYTSTAVCTEKTTVLRIPIVDFNRIISKNQTIYKNFITRFCSKLRATESRLCTQAEPAANKIAVVLKQHYQRSGPVFQMTRSELAQLTGLTVETVIRALSVLKKKHILGGTRGVIKILKPEAL